MSVNTWRAVNSWGAATEPLVISAALGGSTTQALRASITINGEAVTINAALGSSVTSGLPASVTITPVPSQPVIINAALGSTYSRGYRASVTIGTVTIRIYSETHYEIPNY
ncbi:MAG: hypothetical protein WA981_00915 [Glaciecola sp.]